MKSCQPGFLVSLLIFAAISPLAVCGQQTSERQLSPLPVEESLGQRSFLNQTPISLSRDGRMVAYTLRDTRRTQPQDVGPSRAYSPSGVLLGLLGSDVWVSDINTESSKFNRNCSSWGPAWHLKESMCLLRSQRRNSALVRERRVGL